MSPRVLLLDNYDSFTYNLEQALRMLGAEVRVFRNDKITVEQAEDLNISHLVISPGPGRPEDAGVSMELLRHYMERLPILGVCLGHQAMAQVLGGRVVYAPRLMHGKASEVQHDGEGVYRGLPNPFQAARYHSLIVERESLPACLVPTAETPEGELMGMRHRSLPVEGVQFHPESVLTPAGNDLLANFLATGTKA
jgi:anthranilate synthase component 2/para-aminobenzoate synthetase component 2